MTGKDRVLDLRDNRVVEADDSRQDALATRELDEKIAPHLLTHRPHLTTVTLELSEGYCPLHAVIPF